MTTLQANFLKGLSFSTLGIAFGFGASWVETKRDISEKVDQSSFEQHVIHEAQADSSISRRLDAMIDASCVREHDPYKRLHLQCDQRGIK